MLLLGTHNDCESISQLVVQMGQTTGGPERGDNTLKVIVLQVKATVHFPPLKMSTQVYRACYLMSVLSAGSHLHRPAAVCKRCGNRGAVRINGVAVGQ